MKWTFEWDGADVKIYDHNGDHVTTAKNSESPKTVIPPDGIPTTPDVRGAICDYLCDEIDDIKWPSTDAKQSYLRTAQTILSVGRIE